MELEETFAYLCKQALKNSNGIVATALFTVVHTPAQLFFISKGTDSQIRFIKELVIGWSIKSWNHVDKFRAQGNE